MPYILDTCTLLWLGGDPDRLSKKAQQLIDHPENELAVCDTSLWEIALKYRAGKLPLPIPATQWIEKQLDFFQIQHLSIALEDILVSAELKSDHNDPFDRLIAAQAIRHGSPVITPDQELSKLGANALW